MNLAVCGRGAWGRRYAELIQELDGLELVGIAGRDGWRELVVRGDVDGVVVATAPASHAEIVEASLRAGKAVLCEKPFTLDVESARRLHDLARHRGLQLLVGHTYLWHPEFDALRSAGVPRRVRTDSGNDGPRRADVSALWDYGPHDVAMALALLGLEPDHITAERTPQRDGESWVIRLAWGGGASAELRFSNALPGRRRSLTAEYDWGRMSLEDEGLAADLEARPLTRLLRAFAAGDSDSELGVAVVEVLAAAERTAARTA
jgi:predicted dehydrogenase